MVAVCTAFVSVANVCAMRATKALTALVKMIHGKIATDVQMIAVGPMQRVQLGSTAFA